MGEALLGQLSGEESMTGRATIVLLGLFALGAKGVLHSASGADVGKIEVKQEATGVRIKVAVHGLPPGRHGLHVHANRSCGTPTDSAGPFAGAGPHFDPMQKNFHAGPNGIGHAGDLGNIIVGADGTGRLELTESRVNLFSDSTSIMGHAVILHANPDNLGNSPANGGSGARLACAVLEKD